mmetsp:Transcript_138141/g.441403  ORF Transcript_138141/g.441403 Transcript_138141/m.441403 type:complete len:94 (-) Transcript_138141:640-921(-)
MSTSLSQLFFSSHYMFRPAATGWSASLPFAVVFLSGAFATGIKLRLIWPQLRRVSRARTAPDGENESDGSCTSNAFGGGGSGRRGQRGGFQEV